MGPEPTEAYRPRNFMCKNSMSIKSTGTKLMPVPSPGKDVAGVTTDLPGPVRFPVRGCSQRKVPTLS